MGGRLTERGAIREFEAVLRERGWVDVVGHFSPCSDAFTVTATKILTGFRSHWSVSGLEIMQIGDRRKFKKSLRQRLV